MSKLLIYILCFYDIPLPVDNYNSTGTFYSEIVPVLNYYIYFLKLVKNRLVSGFKKNKKKHSGSGKRCGSDLTRKSQPRGMFVCVCRMQLMLSSGWQDRETPRFEQN